MHGGRWTCDSGPVNTENPQIPYLPTTKSLLVGTLVGTHRDKAPGLARQQTTHMGCCVYTVTL